MAGPFKTKEEAIAFLNNLPAGVREDMLKGGKTQSPIGNLAIAGVTYTAVKNPLKTLEILGVAGTDPGSFQDVQTELIQQQGSLFNPVRKVKNIGKGLRVLGDVAGDIISPRQPALATANASINPNVLRIEDTSSTSGSLLTNRGDLKAFRKTPKGKSILEKAYEYFEEHGSLKGFEEGKEFGVVARNKVGRNKVDFQNRKGLSLDIIAGREADALKRARNTKIIPEDVYKLAEKYNLDRSVAEEFIKVQQAGKQKLESIVAKINERVKDKLASLGHIVAAEKRGGAADILSNLELEDFFRNVKRSNKDELPDELTRALGVSRNLEEEFLRHVFPELQSFWKMSKMQKNRLKAYVARGMDVNDALKKVGFGDTNIHGVKINNKKEALQFLNKASN